MASLRLAICARGRVVARLEAYLLERVELLLLIVRKMAVMGGGVLERLGAREVGHSMFPNVCAGCLGEGGGGGGEQTAVRQELEDFLGRHGGGLSFPPCGGSCSDAISGSQRRGCRVGVRLARSERHEPQLSEQT